MKAIYATARVRTPNFIYAAALLLILIHAPANAGTWKFHVSNVAVTPQNFYPPPPTVPADSATAETVGGSATIGPASSQSTPYGTYVVSPTGTATMTITGTYTLAPNETMPEVIISENSIATCVAGELPSYGSCSTILDGNGLGDSPHVIGPTLTNDGHIVTQSTASGTHYQVCTNGTFTRTISITGTGSGADPHWQGSVSLGYTVTAAPVAIRTSGTDVDAAGNLGALIGQNISASLSAGPYALSNYWWNVPGHTFRQWLISPDQTSATILLVDPATWALPNPSWYWKDNDGNLGFSTSEDVLVGATATAPNGTNLGIVHASQPIDLFAPMGSFVSTTGQLSSYDSISGVDIDVLSSPDGLTPGMSTQVKAFTPLAYFPGGLPPAKVAGWGALGITQLISKDKITLSAVDATTTEVKSNGFVLDNGNPYFGSAPAAPPMPPGFHVYTLSIDDSPQSSLLGDTAINLADLFKDYVMYTPPGVNSSPVPIMEVEWSWIVNANCLSPIGGGWTNPPGATMLTNFSYTTDFPLWSEKYTNGQP